MKPLFEKLHDGAIIPTRATAGSAGYDLHLLDCVRSGEECSFRIKTGIKANIPKGFYGKIEARSSYASRYGCQILGGVIDSDYECEIIIFMSAAVTPPWRAGERVAQLVIMPYYSSEDVTAERTGGFGSTGN